MISFHNLQFGVHFCHELASEREAPTARHRDHLLYNDFHVISTLSSSFKVLSASYQLYYCITGPVLESRANFTVASSYSQFCEGDGVFGWGTNCVFWSHHSLFQCPKKSYRETDHSFHLSLIEASLKIGSSWF
ncbi:hypothetical protein POM88_040187 [Heracleum sosnowskyi]|uniref:Uncharacterized protein n=1 Tax=Heracleum sosnowskyi TaxID=360622 RepID=A0AAD8HCQ4_9APIA|nr:hypothetical protein POM88_040187 [Heracleum sosnowskyi]